MALDPTKLKTLGGTSILGGPTTQDFIYDGKNYTSVVTRSDFDAYGNAAWDRAMERVVMSGKSEQLNRDPVTGLVNRYNQPLKETDYQGGPNAGIGGASAAYQYGYQDMIQPQQASQLSSALSKLSQTLASYRAPSTVNSNNATQQLAVGYQSPRPTPILNIQGIDSTIPQAPTMELTPSERSVQDLIGRLQGLENQTVGKSAYKAQQEQAQGIPALLRTQQDLASQLTALKAEAASIPLQLESGAAGRGITTQMLGAQQQALLRTNAIKALSIDAMLQASRGNLALAYDQVDRAVAAQFDPIEEQIAATRSNLDLILKSPQYSVDEKNRALAQQEIQNARKDALDHAKEEKKNIYNIQISAAEKGASASVLREISQAQSAEEALQIAGRAGVFRKEVGTGAEILSPTEATALGVPYGTTKQEAFGKTPQKPATAAQQAVAGYAARLEQSEQTLSNLENSIANMNVAKFKVLGVLPSAFQGSTYQQYDQAARNFINAVLRKESGAAISAGEFADARKQYLPVAGDSEETLRQKKLNRELQFQTFKRSAGSAYSSVNDLLSNPSGANSQEVDVYVTPDGVEYVKGEDGLYYPTN